MLRKETISSTTFRLTLAVAILFTGSVMVLFVFIFRQTNAYDVHRLSGLMTVEAGQLASVVPADLPRALAARRASGPYRETLVSLFGADGSRIWGKLAALPPGLTIDGRIHQLAGLSPGDRGNLALALALSLPGGRILLITRSIATLTELHIVVVHALLLGVMPLVLLGLLAGVVLSMRTARRLRTIHEAIARIMHGDLSERLPVSGGRDDLDRLTLKMNHMLDEIQHLVAECKSMGDDIARDLCTPLTRIRARLDRGHSSVGTTEEAHGLIDASIADLDITFGIMTTLLRIGEIESGRRRAGFREVDLAEIALEVGEIYAPMAEAIPLSLDIRTPCTAPMLGDRDLLVEALANLVTNAIKVTPPSGHITIAVDATPAGPALSVSDTGPGMPLSVREFVLRRFNRGGTAPHMPGGGLGLCLVASITRLHDLHLAIESGPGCVFKLLPTRACTS